MSTILDSLKKSSDQRDDNSKTPIDNFNFGSGKQSSKSGLTIVLVIIILTLAILYFGYDYLYADTSIEAQAQTTSESKQSIPTNKDSKQKANQLVNSKQKKQKPNSSTVKQKLMEINNIAELSKNKSVNKKDSKTKIQKPTTGVDNTSKSNGKPLQKLTFPNRNKQQKKPQEVIEKQKYLFVYQLPFSVRKELPKLKLNIHVYDKDPLNRIAVINGVRFEVDDSIDELVLLKDILQNGVLLEFNGHEFLVPNF